MTPADLAKHSAISFEAKKDSLRQMQNGDWKVSFTVQAVDMDKRLTMALPGARYMAVLVEIGADEIPIHQPKEVMPNPQLQSTFDAQPQPKDKPAGAKREWRNVPPVEQAGMRSQQPMFYAFLREEYGFMVETRDQAAVVIRQLCKVESRKEFETDPVAKARWQGLDDQYLAWRFVDA